MCTAASGRWLRRNWHLAGIPRTPTPAFVSSPPPTLSPRWVPPCIWPGASSLVADDMLTLSPSTTPTDQPAAGHGCRRDRAGAAVPRGPGSRCGGPPVPAHRQAGRCAPHPRVLPPHPTSMNHTHRMMLPMSRSCLSPSAMAPACLSRCFSVVPCEATSAVYHHPQHDHRGSLLHQSILLASVGALSCAQGCPAGAAPRRCTTRCCGGGRTWLRCAHVGVDWVSCNTTAVLWWTRGATVAAGTGSDLLA
jgi:hypothetical protein